MRCFKIFELRFLKKESIIWFSYILSFSFSFGSCDILELIKSVAIQSPPINSPNAFISHMVPFSGIFKNSISKCPFL